MVQNLPSSEMVTLLFKEEPMADKNRQTKEPKKKAQKTLMEKRKEKREKSSQKSDSE